jgi:hypothetical protein
MPVPESRTCGRHPPCEGGAAHRRSAGELGTPEQGRRLLDRALPSTPRELRDHAMVAMLIGCGLRRAELLAQRLDSMRQREDHWVIADLVGKGGHIRTVPIPTWVKTAVDAWTWRRRLLVARSSVPSTKPGACGEMACPPRCCGMSSAPQRREPASTSWRLTTSGAHAPDCVTSRVVNWIRSRFCWGTFRFRPPSATWDANRSSGRR